MKRGKLLGIVFVILLVAAMLVPACAPQPAKVYEITFNVPLGMDPMSPERKVQEGWGKWVEQESKGRLKITWLPPGAIAGSASVLDAVSKGMCDIGQQLIAFMPGSFPVTEMLELPCIFKSPAALQALHVHIDLLDKYPQFTAEWGNVHILAPIFAQPAQILTTKKQIRTMEDVKGMSILALGQVGAEMIKRLGGTPMFVAQEETYDALAKGVMDGVALSFAGCWLFGYQDSVNYATACDLQQTALTIVMNRDKFNSLPPDLREFFEGEKAQLFSDVWSYLEDVRDAVQRKNFNGVFTQRGNPEIYVLPDAERARWVEALTPIWGEWVTREAAKGVPAQAMLDDCVKLAEQYKWKGEDPRLQKVVDEWLALAPK